MYTRRGALVAAGVGLAGCGSPSEPSTDGTDPTAGEYWYPHPDPTGNRALSGVGSIRGATPVTIPAESPSWLVALPADDGSDWVVVTDDGTPTRYRVADGEVTERETDDPLGDRVPVVRRSSEGTGLVRPPPSVAPMAPPAFTDSGARLAIGTDRDLLVTRGGETTRVDVGGLRDGRIVRVSEGRYALLGDATDRYRHRALGDAVEGGSLVVVDGRGRIRMRRQVGLPAVVEAQAPLVADLNADGRPELLAPVSDAADGARIVAFDPDGTRLGTGPIEGNGWRHPLAVAPFGPGGEPELAVVRKPHVEHVLEFYRLDGGLSVAATRSGFRSHTYGSRTLDGALAADFDDDGAVELLVPTTPRDRLAAVRRLPGAASVAWHLPLGGPLRTNVAGVALEAGLAVGAGTADEVRVWQG